MLDPLIFTGLAGLIFRGYIMAKKKKVPKERNQFVALARFRKAGSHKRSKRKDNKDSMKDESFSLLGLKL